MQFFTSATGKMPKFYDIFISEDLDFIAKPQLWKQDEQTVTLNLFVWRKLPTSGVGTES
jgi:hypothetical protein